MASLDWSQCAAVESVPGMRSGAWVFRDTWMPIATIFEKLEVGTKAKSHHVTGEFERFLVAAVDGSG
jgi:uncharacterized protein (DUF433 family)